MYSFQVLPLYKQTGPITIPSPLPFGGQGTYKRTSCWTLSIWVKLVLFINGYRAQRLVTSHKNTKLGYFVHINARKLCHILNIKLLLQVNPNVL